MTSGLSRARQRSGHQSTPDHSRSYPVRGLVYLCTNKHIITCQKSPLDIQACMHGGVVC